MNLPQEYNANDIIRKGLNIDLNYNLNNKYGSRLVAQNTPKNSMFLSPIMSPSAQQ